MLLPLVCVLSFICSHSGYHIDIDDIPYSMEEGYEQVYQGEIKGPKSFDDYIAIVGAGPSGIHMAYLLKEKGYKNVHIFEKTDRLGGKSLSINHRGAVHEMGTAYVSPDYEKNVIKLIKKFTNSTLVAPPFANIRSLMYPGGLSLQKYVFQRLSVKYPDKNLLELKASFFNTMKRYSALHYQLFGKYEGSISIKCDVPQEKGASQDVDVKNQFQISIIGDLMSEPNNKTKHLLRGTFSEFLHRHNMTDLSDLFIASFTLQGYGRLHEVPALYGLMWNTPKLMRAMGKVLGGEKETGLYLLKEGFENLWKTMVDTEKLNVIYNADIRYVYVNKHATDVYGNKNKVFLYYGIHSSGKTIIKSVDFLIWTPSPKELLNLIGGAEMEKEREVFSNIQHAYYTTTLVDSIGERRTSSPVDWYYNNINNGRDMKVWASRDSYSALNNIHGEDYQSKVTKTSSIDNDITKRSSVFYQYSKATPDSFQLRKELENHLKSYNATNVEVIQQHIWPYFERFNEVDTEHGFHWRVLDLQGVHNIWFTGATVCFESVKSVLEYNKLLTTIMKN